MTGDREVCVTAPALSAPDINTGRAIKQNPEGLFQNLQGWIRKTDAGQGYCRLSGSYGLSRWLSMTTDPSACGMIPTTLFSLSFS